MSLNEVARRAEIARTQLAKIVSGATPNPGIASTAKIARALGVSVDYLLVGVDDIEGPEEIPWQRAADLLWTLGRMKDATFDELVAYLEQTDRARRAPAEDPARAKVGKPRANNGPEKKPTEPDTK